MDRHWSPKCWQPSERLSFSFRWLFKIFFLLFPLQKITIDTSESKDSRWKKVSRRRRKRLLPMSYPSPAKNFEKVIWVSDKLFLSTPDLETHKILPRVSSAIISQHYCFHFLAKPYFQTKRGAFPNKKTKKPKQNKNPTCFPYQASRGFVTVSNVKGQYIAFTVYTRHSSPFSQPAWLPGWGSTHFR